MASPPAARAADGALEAELRTASPPQATRAPPRAADGASEAELRTASPLRTATASPPLVLPPPLVLAISAGCAQLQRPEHSVLRAVLAATRPIPAAVTVVFEQLLASGQHVRAAEFVWTGGAAEPGCLVHSLRKLLVEAKGETETLRARNRTLEAMEQRVGAAIRVTRSGETEALRARVGTLEATVERVAAGAFRQYEAARREHGRG